MSRSFFRSLSFSRRWSTHWDHFSKIITYCMPLSDCPSHFISFSLYSPSFWHTLINIRTTSGCCCDVTKFSNILVVCCVTSKKLDASIQEVREKVWENDWKRKVTTISITHFSWMHFYRYLVAKVNDKTGWTKCCGAGKRVNDTTCCFAATKYILISQKILSTIRWTKKAKRMHVTGASYSIRFVFNSFVLFLFFVLLRHFSL